jgi:hypothetical protein
MSKDVNIHVKTTGTQQSTGELNQVAQATEEMGAKSSRAAGWLKEAFTALIGPLSIGIVAGFIVAGVRKIISAFDDMKRATAEAVQNMASLQRSAGSFFEAMDAYSSKNRRAALAQARGVQAATGLPFEASMQLLEAQKRTFGEIQPAATEQFAAYQLVHAMPSSAITDLVRWMGASGIKTTDQQGRIMRMISTVAKKSNLQEEDIITAISSRSERFRAMGWSPEQTITNIGKALSGVSPAESGKAMRGMFEALESFDEAKAREMRAPPQIAKNEQARLEWLKTKAAGLPLERRIALLRQAFGPSYPYINKMIFEPTSPEMQKALEYAASPEAAQEEQKRAAEYRGTAEVTLEQAKGGAGLFELNVSRKEELKTAIREYGKQYLEYIRRADRLKYEKLQLLPEEYRYERAALELWQQIQPEIMVETPALGLPGMPGGIPAGRHLEKPGWGNLTEEERLAGVEQAARTVNINYITNFNYFPIQGSAGDRDIGPRAPRTLK